MSLLRTLNVAALNSATKYPSIPTYHKLGEKGVLSEEKNVTFDAVDTVVVTEKIDGTNTRVVILPDGEYVIGSREELLWASGDVIHNPALGIVDGLRPILREVDFTIYPWISDENVVVIYGEFFGKGVGGAWKNYTAGDNTSFRVFDFATVRRGTLDLPVETIALQRQRGEIQQFILDTRLFGVAGNLGFHTVPAIDYLRASGLPSTVAETHEWLREVSPTTTIDITPPGGGKPSGEKSEGVVVRTANRSKIAKIRHRDYLRWERTRETGK